MKRTKKNKNRKSIKKFNKKGGSRSVSDRCDRRTKKKEVELSAQEILNNYPTADIDSKTFAIKKSMRDIPNNILSSINYARRQIKFAEQEINEQKYNELALKILNPCNYNIVKL